MKKEGKVLIVEEHPTLVAAIEAAGSQFGITCDSATDGWEAIEKLETGKYTAIVIDSDMPRHSGFGVITYLREEVGDELQNVIVTTSSDEDTLRRKLSEHKLKIVRKDGAVDALSHLLAAD